MNLPEQYLRSFRKRGRKSCPIWPIATDVSCGDIGTFEDGEFIKSGSLEGKIDKALLATELNPVPGVEEFSSSVDINFGGAAGVNPIPGTELSGEMTFATAGGVYLEATDIVETRFKELGALRNAVRGLDLMEPKEVFISSVSTFASATLLVSNTAGWTLAITGKAPASPVKLANASVNLSVKSGSGQKRHIPGDKSVHPYCVRIQGRRGWFSDRIVMLSESDAGDASDFVEVTGAYDETD